MPKNNEEQRRTTKNNEEQQRTTKNIEVQEQRRSGVYDMIMSISYIKRHIKLS